MALLSAYSFGQNSQSKTSEKLYGRLTSEQLQEAQRLHPVIQSAIDLRREELKLTSADAAGWVVSDIYSNEKTNCTYVYIQQQLNQVRVFNAVSPMAIRGNTVLTFNSRFISGLATKANATTPALSPEAAIGRAASHLGITMRGEPARQLEVTTLNKLIFDKAGISSEPIQVTLLLLPRKNDVRLVWNVNIAPIGSSNWWNVRVDAVDGTVLGKNDWTVHCDFGAGMEDASGSNATPAHASGSSASMMSSGLPVYNVFEFPVEAPSFGSRTLVSNPADSLASPFGWHDVDGNPGEEYTTTQGNNVYAYDDIANQDAPGTFADGGALLNFDFPVNLNQAPSTYLEASLTNLFYVNNRVHDVLYHYGLDEASGNFQENNYNRGGAGNDYVLAECQDGGGTNNANFATPDDGQNGRMQMYLWAGGSSSELILNSPAGIAGTYTAVEAGFGPSITVPVTANLILVDDATGTTSDGCDPIVNGAAIAGNIAVIDRGNCNFVAKVNAAEALGAVAVIVCNNAPGAPFAMGGTGTANIPSVMISQADGDLIKNSLAGGNTVNGTLNPPSVGSQDLDGSFDNGIVAHEFGHGVSNRLTGGPNNSNCLFNGEQGGEGWSDYFALLFTIEPGDQGTDSRGIGTYALSEPNSGLGIRRYPYSTDMNINPQTYADLASSPGVHDVGEIWCGTIWDMTWALIDQFGFDPDWINGTGGNNIALRLVMEGMKLQPCGPGFIDARDAILAADANLYSNAHRCIIWSSFARRGMGANADQGDPDVAGDETEDFTLPSFCLTPTAAPVADFEADVTNTCYSRISFTDLSTNIAQSWLWDFGDGSTSTDQNPVHTYTASGTYTVTLIVTNTIGSDTLSRNSYITIALPATPAVSGSTSICEGETTTLTASLLSGNDAEWRDNNGVLLATGASFTTPALNSAATYSVRQFTPTPLQNVGPVNNAFGAGGYHNTSFEGRQEFTTFRPLRINSVWVDASGSTNRTINLYSGNGTLLQSLTVNIPNGQSRVTLNFDIPAPGDYQLGVVAGSNLYRNNSGASYPYTINGLLSITSSNSTSSPSTFFYYLYDWEVQESPCTSAPAVVNVNVDSDPVAGFTVNATGLTCQFSDASIGTVATYLWDFGNGSTSNQSNPSVIYAQAGTYIVTLTVTTAAGCTDSYTDTVSVTTTGIGGVGGGSTVIFGTREQIIVRFDPLLSGNANISVYDLVGKEIVSRDVVAAGEIRLPLTGVSSQIVTVRVIDVQGTRVKKLFLNKE